MKGNKRIITPTQLSLFSISELGAQLEELVIRGKFNDKIPEESELEKQLIKDGERHERVLIESLKGENNNVVKIGDYPPKQRIIETINAMKNKATYIYQASLENSEMKGTADILRITNQPSKFGDWSYIPIECKLSSKSKTTFIVQSCAYCDLLESIQGTKADYFELYLGGMKFEKFETKKYWNWYTFLKKRYKVFLSCFNEEIQPQLIPDNHGKWTDYVNEKLKERRDLIIVAGMTKSQRIKLIKNDIKNIDDFAALKANNKIFGSKKSTLRNLHNQAKVQCIKKTSDGKPNLEPRMWSDVDEDNIKIKNILPLKNKGDIWFDMEGFHDSVTGVKLEYLFGACYEKNGQIEFEKWWAHNPQQECDALENWINWVEDRRKNYPELHIYHYGNYEKDAMRKLQQKYPNSSAVGITDDWLRDGLLIDLLDICKRAIYLGEESYSIKKVEKLYKGKRKTEITTAADSVVAYQRFLESGEKKEVKESPLLQNIEKYNKDDCESTEELHTFLFDLKKEYKEINLFFENKIDDEVSKEIKPNAYDQINQISNDIFDQIPKELRFLDNDNEVNEASNSINDIGPLGLTWKSQRVLSQLLRFHSNEAKNLWWRYFDRKKADIFELEKDSESIHEAIYIGKKKDKDKKLELYNFKFEPFPNSKLQSDFLDGGLEMEIQQTGLSLTVQKLEEESGIISFKMQKTKCQNWKNNNKDIKFFEIEEFPGLPKNCSLFKKERDLGKTLIDRLLPQAESWIQNKESFPLSLKTLLERRGKNELIELNKILKNSNSGFVNHITEYMNSQKSTTLAIQGPPGTGKTTLIAEVIIGLCLKGKRIAISANSHPAIDNLLIKIKTISKKKSIDINVVKSDNSKSSERKKKLQDNSIITINSKKIKNEMTIVGGTTWAHSIDESINKYDVLVIEEAGQMSLANVAVISRCAKSIILVGDQQQLPQPTKATHKFGGGLSALEYWMNNEKVVPDNLGIFLDKSWRMEPSIAKIVSDLFYDGKLKSHINNKINKIIWSVHVQSSNGNVIPNQGFHFENVPHFGNSQTSKEEASKIKDIVEKLNGSRYEYFSEGKMLSGKITHKEILVIAPYNAQVNLLKNYLKDKARVSTVDKFQGQEAPISIFSLTSSTGNDAPRGLDFLLQPNRLNVAISRAKCLSIIVGSNHLSSTLIKSIKDAELINTFCKISNN